MLELEIQYFNENRPAWLARYPRKVVVVKGRELVGAFDSPEQALAVGARLYGLRPFLVRRVEQTDREVYIPALALGLLNANPAPSV